MIAALLLQLSAAPLPSAEGPVRTYVETRDLVRGRRFAELDHLLRSRRDAAVKDPTKDEELKWSFLAFRSDDTDVPILLDDWVKQDSKSWVPLLARAMTRGARALAARGTGWASETSAAQFRAMSALEDGVRADCRAALTLEPALCPCHSELIIASRDGESQAADTNGKAFEACPKNYVVHVERLFGLTPRWGGSYEAMQAAIEQARRAGLDDALVRNLGGYIPADKASMLELSGRPDEARKVLNEAIAQSPGPLLYQERAELSFRMIDSAAALRDANMAIESSNGGWIFSQRRLTSVLQARVSALMNLGRKDEATADVALLAVLSPYDTTVRKWQEYLQVQPWSPSAPGGRKPSASEEPSKNPTVK